MHKVILVSCSDYFRSMFTSGMKECSQREIELKGVTSKGLEKVLEVIYTSTTTLEGDDIFDVIAAATHLQVTSWGNTERWVDSDSFWFPARSEINKCYCGCRVDPHYVSPV